MTSLRPLAHALACGLLALSSGCGGGVTGPVDGDKALAHAKKICEYGPRPAGGKNLTAVAIYLQGEVRKIGLEPKSDRWTEKVGLPGRATVEFQNIWTEIPGADPEKGPIIVLGAHYDTKLCEGHPEPERNFPFVGAIDSAGSCGLLLELARVLKDRKTPLNVWCVWFDGEESITWDWKDGATALIGSKRFVKRMAEDKARFPSGVPARCRAMVLMDLIGDKDQKIDKDVFSDATLIKLFGDAAARMGEQDRMYRYETKLAGGDDHVPFKDYGVPAIDLIDFKWRTPAEHAQPRVAKEDARWFPFWHTKDDTPDRLSAKSLAFVGNLIWTAWPDLEKFCGIR